MPETWEVVAEQVKRRRLELRLSQRSAADAAGISPTTWQSLELHHKPVGDLTKHGIARALGWPADAIDQLLAGETVEPLSSSLNGSADSESWDDLKSSLSEEDRAVIRAMIERLQAKQR